MIRLLSVARTGTRFTKKILDDHNLKYFHTHFWGKYNIPDYDGVIVIPRRDKEACRPRWNQYHSRYAYGFDDVWLEMEDYIERNRDNVYQLHVDDPNERLLELQQLSYAVGVDLHADFSKKVGEGRP